MAAPAASLAISADEARRRLAAYGALPAESVALAEAGGRVLADDVRAPEPLPPWRRAAMDGVAVRAADVATAPATLALVGAVPVGGAWSGELAAGQAVSIATGGVLPAGADAVVMIEHTSRRDGAVTISRAAAPGQHIIGVGDDLAEGALVAARGRVLGPPQLAALAALGQARVAVVRRPRVAVLSTGSEVVAASATPAVGQVRDANQAALAAAASGAGALVGSTRLVPDDPAALREALARALADADVVLISGGSSVGERDHTADVLAGLGLRIDFHGLAIRPGRPTLLAVLPAGSGSPGARPRLVFGLPGVPASALIIFHALVADVLARLAGHAAAPRRVRGATLAHDVDSAPGREDWLRVAVDAAGMARVLPGGQMSLGTLVAADGLVRVPADVPRIPAGAAVEVELFA